MARSALGAILAGLGGGLTGYAQEQQRKRDELDRNRQRTLQEALNAASLMNEGWESPEAFARRQERVGRPAVRDVAALSRFAVNPLAQPAPAVAPEGVAGIAEAQRITGGPAGRVQIGERELVLPMGKRDQSMIDRALAGAERRMEGQVEAGRRRGELRLQATQTAEENRRQEAARASLAREQMASAERIAGIRGAGTGAIGGIQQDILPTVIRNAQELKMITPNDIKAMNPTAVFGATVAPMMLAEPSARNLLLAGIGNVAGRTLGSGKEQLYAQYIGSIGDAAARIGERIGVLTNQDIARYRAQVTPIIGDSDEVRLRKHENLVSWANYLAGLGQIAQSGNLSNAQIEQLRQQAQQLGGGGDERTMFLTWQEQNPKMDTESSQQYVARFRSALGLGGRR